MKPRDLIDFFKTGTGKLVAFAAILGAGLLLFSALRDRTEQGDQLEDTRPNRTLPPQTVQTVARAMEPYRPPPPKPEPPPQVLRTNAVPKPVEAPPPKPEPLAPISLFADSAAGVAEPKSLSSIYAPYGRLISCETVVTVDSASIRTPIVGLVIENVYHAGQLVISAGTEVHGTAQADRQRERIASGNTWTLVWQTGEELQLNGIVLDREFSGDQEGMMPRFSRLTCNSFSRQSTVSQSSGNASPIRRPL